MELGSGGVVLMFAGGEGNRIKELKWFLFLLLPLIDSLVPRCHSLGASLSHSSYSVPLYYSLSHSMPPSHCLVASLSLDAFPSLPWCLSRIRLGPLSCIPSLVSGGCKQGYVSRIPYLGVGSCSWDS
ncbi:hypothetical protein RJT34_03018 [Clitoria ternatea]|uniref:Uncharacterized protein n=1 Tax=Clitoria ternatea TaxID=43366 RepID=A0AAN9Q245_CLITE